MKILALDTATEACSVALLHNDEIIEQYQIAPRQHTTIILPMLQAILDEASLTLGSIDVLAFGCGPGSFAGVRIAATIIQGIGFAHDLPVVPVSTLRALAQACYRETQAEYVLAAIDARMEEIYAGFYSITPDKVMQAMAAEVVCAPSELSIPEGVIWSGIGSGWDSYQQILQNKLGTRLQQWLPNRYPRASDIARLARVDYQQHKFVSAEQALPVYLRDDVVKQKG